MNLSLILNIVVILLGFIFMSGDNTEKRRRAYMIICFGLLMFFNAFKSLYVGADTAGYYDNFVSYSQLSWSEVWSRFIDRYLLWQGEYDEGFVIYVKLMQVFTRDYIVFQFISSLWYFIPFGIIMMRYVRYFRQQIFAFVLYITLLYGCGSIFSRQQMATVLLMWSFISVMDDKYFRAILLNMIALTLHMSSMIFFIVPIVSYFFRNGIKKIHLMTFFLIPIVILYSTQIIRYMGDTLGNERYSSYGDMFAGGGVAFTVLMELLTLLCYIGIDKYYLEEDSQTSKLYIMVPFATLFAPLIMQDGVLIRLSKYFFLYLTLLVPIAIDRFFKNGETNKDTMTFVYVTSMGVLLLYSALSTIEYTAIWDVPYLHHI